MRRPVWILAACLSGAFASMCAVTTYSVLSKSMARDLRQGQAASSLPARPAAPAELFGFGVGQMSVDAAMSHAEEIGLVCVDRSMKTLMAEMRATHSRGADSVSTASARRKADKPPRVIPPQVRMHCTGRLGSHDAAELAAPSSRVLLVFDGPEAPLRHVSLHSTHRDMDRAVRDFERTTAVLEKTLGPASRTDGTRIARLNPVVREWHLGATHARVTALDFGSRVSVTREVFLPDSGSQP